MSKRANGHLARTSALDPLRPVAKLVAAAVVGLAALFTAAGVFGTITLMWLPDL